MHALEMSIQGKKPSAVAPHNLVHSVPEEKPAVVRREMHGSLGHVLAVEVNRRIVWLLQNIYLASLKQLQQANEWCADLSRRPHSIRRQGSRTKRRHSRIYQIGDEAAGHRHGVCKYTR